MNPPGSTEAAICSVRLRLADKIRRSDLLALESIGEADIHARISRDTAAIAQAARPLFAAAQGVVMILCTLGYIAMVSPVAMLLCLILIAGGAGKYFKDRAAYDRGLQDASKQEDELSESLNGLLKGFKELRINKLKSDDVFQEFQSHHHARPRRAHPRQWCCSRTTSSLSRCFSSSCWGQWPSFFPSSRHRFPGRQQRLSRPSCSSLDL